MAKVIQFDDLTQAQALKVANLTQKLEALDALLAVVQNERAAKDAEWSGRENYVRGERTKVVVQIREIRQAQIVDA